MASGKLGSAALAAAADTVVYPVPANTVATVNISVVNRGDTDAVVNLAISDSDTPSSKDFIEYGVTIPPHGVLERTAIVVGAGEKVIARSSTANCSVCVFGFTEEF